MKNSAPPPHVQTAIAEFLSDPSQWGISLSGTGAVYRLERKFASLVGHPHALAVTSATLGLWAVLTGLEIHDAEVITTPYTWGGTLAGLLLTGNRPVFADIDPQTLTLDPEKIVRCITPRTRAILAVDIYGYPADGQALREIADQHGLVLIQDCAQSFGAYRGGHHTGWWADAAVFSFTWGKTLFAGEGGLIVTRHPELLEQLVWETQHPHRQLRDVPSLPANEMAMNLRIHPLSAVWADAAFDDALAGMEEHRNERVQLLSLLERERMSKTKVPDGRCIKPSFHALTFEPRCEPAKIVRFLQENHPIYRLSSPPVVEPLYLHESYRRVSLQNGWGEPNRCPVAEKQCRRRLRLVKSNVSSRSSIPGSH